MRFGFVQICLCLLLSYFAYHTVAGNQGLARWADLQKQEKVLALELAAMELERQALEAEIIRLNPNNLDLDYVEELARRKLAYARAGELIVTVNAYN